MCDIALAMVLGFFVGVGFGILLTALVTADKEK